MRGWVTRIFVGREQVFLEGTVLPDYSRVIAMAANEALKKMLTPSLIALVVPVVGGFMFGPEFVGGILIGATITAIPTAIFMGNSGGAFDIFIKTMSTVANTLAPLFFAFHLL